MSDTDDLRARLEHLESEVAQLRADQAAIRHLAVNSDRDTAALQEQRRADVQLLLLQALRQTQLDQNRVLETHGLALTEQSTVLGALLAGQVAIMQQLGIEPPAPPGA
jgi:DNA-nicking Smr family endonuclease